MALPFTFQPEISLAVYKESKTFLEKSGYEEKISGITWIYHYVGDLIPQPLEALWSGHFFPWKESYEDLQISCVLCLFGFYKQAMGTLRSTLELGLLSVYWNLNDDGHKTVKRWFHAREETPRNNEIWRRLNCHPNFRVFQSHHDLKKRILDLGRLSNYVHTKGHKFSNALGRLKGNSQTFEEDAFKIWFSDFTEVVKVVAICHLIKYPLGTVRFMWDDKFGIDKPWFGSLDEYQVDRLENFIGNDIFLILSDIAKKDPHVAGIINWAENLPDLSPEDVDQQFLNFDKFLIEMSGLDNWLRDQGAMLPHVKNKDRWQQNIEQLTKWAKANGFDKHPFERLKNVR